MKVERRRKEEESRVAHDDKMAWMHQWKTKSSGEDDEMGGTGYLNTGQQSFDIFPTYKDG